MLWALSHFALNVGFVFRLESIKMGCLLSFANGDIYLLDSIIHTTGLQPHTYVVKSDKPSSLNIALHPAKKKENILRGKVQEQPWTGKFFLLHQQDHELADE